MDFVENLARLMVQETGKFSDSFLFGIIIKMFRFQSPYYFFLLIPLLVLIVQCEWRRKPLNVQFSNIELIRTLPYTFAQRLAPFVPYLLYWGMFLWIIALARPQFGKEDYRVRSEGIAIAVCIDRSGSMAAIDFTLNNQPAHRLDVVKQTLRNFIQGHGQLAGRTDDMIGLLAFGGYVDTFCPLTFDHATLLEMLDQIQLPEHLLNDSRLNNANQQLLMEEGVTAIGDALAQAADRLKDVEAKSKVILFLSDGDQTFGVLSPMEGAEIAQTLGIKIYTIGIGSNGEAPYVITDVFGRSRTIMQRVSMDESVLTNIAETTGGKYYNARNTAALESVYAEIDQLEKTTLEGRVYTQYSELFREPLLAGSCLIVFYVVCICTRFRRLP